MPEVACTVSNCKYYKQGNFCTADQIIVQNDAQGGGFGPNAQLSNLAATPANSNDDTCCQTFKNANG
ncbi:protein of unknown function DUF1540 [Desulforamulus reducens MI-1]|uniref:DUF1540 domain-containing protein n=1 Tax=Desulforamulus reducens (strain ATCC BAA-1160 / DSM 100696 / MI-1) TaxID=349161 RepID=A4J680_DESRM|nr:DUF1540 domain-containing protein [Desulforamulus reducens]ABO50583.1 protein of unknown function DUF1540 [Desulforamulus reducens MI-1]